MYLKVCFAFICFTIARSKTSPCRHRFRSPHANPEPVDGKKSSWNIVFVVVVHNKLNCDSDHILPRKNKVETCHRRMEAASGTDALELNGF
jgi:hypothetical protein